MAIQYSGNAQKLGFTPTTKQDIINGVETALLTMGWTTVSGHATTNLLMQSAPTPQGFAIRVRLKDNGGNCVTFSLESTDGTLVGPNSTTQGGGFLLPGAGGYVYAVTGCKYEAWIYVTPDLGVSRTFVAFGCPYIDPSILGLVARAGWMQGDAQSDADATRRQSFRTQLYPNLNNNYPSMQAMFNSTIWSMNTGGQGAGPVGILSFNANSNSASAGVAFEDGDGLIIDALITWGSTSVGATGKIKGQPWDCFVSTAAYAADQTTTMDGHNWTPITDNNNTVAASGTIFKAIS